MKLRGFLILFVALFKFSTDAYAVTAIGTGFFVTANGYLVTAYHVVSDAKTITVRDKSGTNLVATVVAADSINDLVILKVDGIHAALPIASSHSVHPGTKVVTMGFPHVDIQGWEPKVTDGVVSSVSGLDNDPRVFQISVPVQSGNSGGPLVNMDGSVIGIVTAKLNSLSVLSATGDLPQNVNYAVKSNYLLELTSILDALEKNLQKPKKKHLANTEQVADLLSKALVLVIADISDKDDAKGPLTESTDFPNLWLSMKSGDEYSVRFLDGRLQFSLTKVGNSPCRVSQRGEAEKIPDGYSGTLYTSVACPPGWATCNMSSPIIFSTVTPTRIVAFATLKQFNTATCAVVGEEQRTLIWVPH